MKRRSGLTLVEVLVAIFIMGIGLIALLTLFPIGILRVARAIHDERSAQCAVSAHHTSVVFDTRNDPIVLASAGTMLEPPISDFFSYPGPFDVVTKAPLLRPADQFGESYPILVDPIMYYWAASDWVGSVPGYLRRRPASYVQTGGLGDNAKILQHFTLRDDITFDPNFDPSSAPRPGTPKIIAFTNPKVTIQRETRFSWAYLLRRPMTTNRSIVDCSIVVFDKRVTTPTLGAPIPETVFQDKAYFDPAKSTITLDVTGVVPPPIRPGNWIYDATLVQTATNGTAHGAFYRVVAADELILGGNQCVRYEVQTPLRGTFPGAFDATFGGYRGTVIVMEGVAEVFEKGPVQAR